VRETVLGLGGIFFTSADPPRLAQWYRDHLGLPVDANGVALFPARAPSSSNEIAAVWCPFPAGTADLDQDGRGFMINYRVGDLSRMVAQLRAAGIALEGGIEASEYGRFVRLRDPDGNLVELWEPPRRP
jgi:catechol 2,3-dioxygenase-like lactoylglutathione lyase family enzyme